MKKKVMVISVIIIALLLTGILYINNVETIDKSSMWLETAITEITENEELSDQQSDKIIHHLNELIDNKELRMDLKFQEDFIQEITKLDYPETAVLSIEKAHIRVSSPLNYHDGYWVAKIKPPGSPFKLISCK